MQQLYLHVRSHSELLGEHEFGGHYLTRYNGLDGVQGAEVGEVKMPKTIQEGRGEPGGVVVKMGHPLPAYVPHLPSRFNWSWQLATSHHHTQCPPEAHPVRLARAPRTPEREP